MRPADGLKNLLGRIQLSTARWISAAPEDIIQPSMTRGGIL